MHFVLGWGRGGGRKCELETALCEKGGLKAAGIPRKRRDGAPCLGRARARDGRIIHLRVPSLTKCERSQLSPSRLWVCCAVLCGGRGGRGPVIGPAREG